jgi:hypothetical protein
LQTFLSEKKHLAAPRGNTPYSDSDLAFGNCITPSIIPANCTPATNADTPLIYPSNSLPFQVNAYKTNARMFIRALTLTAAKNHILRTGRVPSRSNGITVEYSESSCKSSCEERDQKPSSELREVELGTQAEGRDWEIASPSMRPLHAVKMIVKVQRVD